MNVFLLSANENMSIPDAALYALVGFVIVLLVLALLVGIFYLMGFLFQTKALSKDNLFERKKKESAPVVQTADTDEDEELFAVITAVISSVYDTEAEQTEKPEFVIRKITRK